MLVVESQCELNQTILSITRVSHAGADRTGELPGRRRPAVCRYCAGKSLNRAQQSRSFFTLTSHHYTYFKQPFPFLSFKKNYHAFCHSEPHNWANGEGTPCSFYVVKRASGSARPYSWRVPCLLLAAVPNASGFVLDWVANQYEFVRCHGSFQGRQRPEKNQPWCWGLSGW